MLEQLMPARRQFAADDPIFALHAEALARKAAGAAVVNATLGALADDAGELVVLATVMAAWAELTPPEVAHYAPIAGDPGFLRALVGRHWPGLDAGAGCASIVNPASISPAGSGKIRIASERRRIGIEILPERLVNSPCEANSVSPGGLGTGDWPGLARIAHSQDGYGFDSYQGTT